MGSRVAGVAVLASRVTKVVRRLRWQRWFAFVVLAPSSVLAEARVSSGLAPRHELHNDPRDDLQEGDQTTPPGVSPHVLQTFLASGLTLGLGTGWYLLDDRNVLDWDKPGLKGRLTGASWRFDNNNFGMNFFLHPLFGASTYAFARESHWGVGTSFLASLLSSLTWEMVIEYNERVSINDVIVTPVAGVGIGEFAHKLGYYLSSYGTVQGANARGFRRGGDMRRAALRYALAPTTAIAQWDCAGEPRRDFAEDRLGYRSGMFHSFALSYGLSAYSTDRGVNGWVNRGRATGKLVSLPGYRSPGKGARGFSNAEFSDLELQLDVSTRGAGVRLATNTTLMGYAARELSAAGDGYAHMVGLAVGYEYRNSIAQGTDDRLSFVGFPGVATELFWSAGAISSEVVLRLYPVFAGTSVLAFQRYRNQHPSHEFKTILEREGYVYGFGAVAQLEAHHRLGILHSQFLVRAESIRSAQGLDRDQEHVLDDAVARELGATLELKTWLDLGHFVAAGVAGTSRLRKSSLGSADWFATERSLGLWIGSHF